MMGAYLGSSSEASDREESVDSSSIEKSVDSSSSAATFKLDISIEGRFLQLVKDRSTNGGYMIRISAKA